MFNCNIPFLTSKKYILGFNNELLKKKKRKKIFLFYYFNTVFNNFKNQALNNFFISAPNKFIQKKNKKLSTLPIKILSCN
jgi:hypothetical protein